ncbi:Protein of unknown function [Devosia enhydra]|uniref:Uncharacterized protein n=1 Tax=Devosia enhydra TaxID=665118 RepID=A0A1K2HTW8_9HYPH|nr:ssDNA-binding protein [Devosia enhydra]SFZ81702.1 Protein of unknown function [Devosia enhydra]
MAETKTKQPKVKLVTPVGIAAYAYHHKPDTKGQYADNKFKGQLVLDGDTDMSDHEKKVRDFAAEVFPNDDLSDLHLPWKEYEGDKEEFEGKIILKASTKHKPTVVDTKRQALRKGIEARSGDEVRYVTTLYAYKKTEKVKEGKKIIDVIMFGVSLQLTVVQLVKKNAGGGANLDALDDIDGFDINDVEDFDGGADAGDDGDTGDDNGGDF